MGPSVRSIKDWPVEDKMFFKQNGKRNSEEREAKVNEHHRIRHILSQNLEHGWTQAEIGEVARV